MAFLVPPPVLPQDDTVGLTFTTLKDAEEVVRGDVVMLGVDLYCGVPGPPPGDGPNVWLGQPASGFVATVLQSVTNDGNVLAQTIILDNGLRFVIPKSTEIAVAD